MCTYLTIPDDWNWVCWWCWWVWLNCLCCCCLEWWYEEEEEDELVFGWTLLAFGWWLPLPPPPPVTDVTDIPEVALEDDTELIGETKFPPPPLPPPPPWLRKLQQVGNAQYVRSTSTTNTGDVFFSSIYYTKVFFISNRLFSQPQIAYFSPFLSLKNFLNFPTTDPQIS